MWTTILTYQFNPYDLSHELISLCQHEEADTQMNSLVLVGSIVANHQVCSHVIQCPSFILIMNWQLGSSMSLLLLQAITLLPQPLRHSLLVPRRWPCPAARSPGDGTDKALVTWSVHMRFLLIKVKIELYELSSVAANWFLQALILYYNIWGVHLATSYYYIWPRILVFPYLKTYVLLFLRLTTMRMSGKLGWAAWL